MSGFSLRQRLVGSDTLTFFGAYVTILHLCAQIWGLYCKTEGYLFWEERKAIFSHGTRNRFTLFCKKLQKNWFKNKEVTGV